VFIAMLSSSAWANCSAVCSGKNGVMMPDADVKK